MTLIGFLILGGLAGYFAGKIMKGKGFGLVGNILIGAVGAYTGGIILDLLGFEAIHFVGKLLTATLGAILLVWLIKFFKK